MVRDKYVSVGRDVKHAHFGSDRTIRGVGDWRSLRATTPEEAGSIPAHPGYLLRSGKATKNKQKVTLAVKDEKILP